MLKNLSLKKMALIIFCLVYFFLNFILFSIFNKSYVEKIRNDFNVQNKYSLDIARNYLFQEIDTITDYAKLIADDQIVRYAFTKGEYITVSYDNIDQAIKVVPLNKIAQVKMAADLKNRLFGWQEGKIRRDINFYDSNLKKMIGTGDIIKKKENDKYLYDALGKGDIPGVDVSVVEKEGDNLVLKGIVPIHRTNRIGLVEVYEYINSVLANEIKNSVNREVIIKTEDRIVTSTLYGESGLIESFPIGNDFFKKKSDYYIAKVNNKEIIFHFQPLYNYYGEKIADIGVGFYSEPFEKIYKETMRKFVLSEVFFTFIVLIIIYIFLSFVFEHFESMLLSIKNISEGEYDDKLNISFGKELKMLSSAINNLSRAVKVREKELKELNYTLESKVDTRTLELRESNYSLKTLLDNTGQGILFYGDNFIIDENFSSECIKYFEREIGGMHIADLLFNTENEQSFFIDTNMAILSEKNKRRRRAYMDLLPLEIDVKRRRLKIEYRLIEGNDNKMMVILTDITQIRNLEDKIRSERTTLEMIVKVVTNNIFFKRMLKEFKIMLAQLEEIRYLKSKDDLFMEIHTFKGNFSQMKLVNLSNELNKFEDFIQENYSLLTATFNIKAQERINKIRLALNLEIDTIKNIIGSTYIQENNEFLISKDKVIEIESRIKKELPSQYSEIVSKELSELRKIRLLDILLQYKEYVKELAEKRGKLVEFEIIEIDRVFIEEEKYGELINSLIHIFRNMIDHGIEKPEERSMIGKNNIGKIKCSISKQGNKIQIYVSDDGAGIDFKKIAEKAVAEGWLEESQIDDKQELINLIFKERFSSKSEADEISGRGVGLAAVKKVIESYFGNISVLSEIKKGTEFRIEFREI